MGKWFDEVLRLEDVFRIVKWEYFSIFGMNPLFLYKCIVVMAKVIAMFRYKGAVNLFKVAWKIKLTCTLEMVAVLSWWLGGIYLEL